MAYKYTLRGLFGFSLISQCLILYLWIWQVKPLPDYDGLVQFYLPVKAFLGDQLQNPFCSEYPLGLPFFCALIKACNLAVPALFLLDYLPVLLVIFLNLGLYLLVPAPKILSLSWLIFFAPPVQICLKSYNLHALIAVLVLCALGFFLKTKPRKTWIFAGMSCLLIALSLKHLGLIFYFVLWFLLQKTRNFVDLPLLNKGFFLCLPFAWLFFPVQDLWKFVQNNNLTHNPQIGVPLFLFLCLMALALFGLGFKQSQGHPVQPQLPLWAGLTLLIYPAFFYLCPLPKIPIWLLGLIFLIIYALIGQISRVYSAHSREQFLFVLLIVLHLLSFLLWLSGLGAAYSVYFLTFLVLFPVLCISDRQIKAGIIIFSLSPLIYEPTQTSFERLSPMVNYSWANPFGWQKSSLRELQQEIQSRTDHLDSESMHYLQILNLGVTEQVARALFLWPDRIEPSKRPQIISPQDTYSVCRENFSDTILLVAMAKNSLENCPLFTQKHEEFIKLPSSFPSFYDFYIRRQIPVLF